MCLAASTILQAGNETAWKSTLHYRRGYDTESQALDWAPRFSGGGPPISKEKEMDTQKLRDLLDKRDQIDSEIAATVLGSSKSRAPQKCGHCGEEGHSARTCAKKSGE